VKVTNGNRTQHARANDRLLDLDEICATTRMPEATIRYKRHLGELPFIFKMSRRLVAWESDVLDWVESFRLAEQTDDSESVSA
jgi:predicted DNA-binding transcriptional regulator AlpA